MHVAQLLDALFRGPDVEVVEAGLPEWQAWHIWKQKPLAGVDTSLFRQESVRRALFQNLHDGGRRSYLRLGDEQVEVLGHDHISHNHETVALASLFEDGEEPVAASQAAKLRPAVIAGTSDKVQVKGAVSAWSQAGMKAIVQATVVPALAKKRKDGAPTFQNGKEIKLKGWATRPFNSAFVDKGTQRTDAAMTNLHAMAGTLPDGTIQTVDEAYQGRKPGRKPGTDGTFPGVLERLGHEG